MFKIKFLLALALSTLLFIYSFGFLDFNLTLSSNALFLSFVSPLQYLVYFNRPLSVKVFISIFAGLFALYLTLKKPIKSNSIFPWRLFISLIIILTVSYPMLSYDVFNYMFHQKILWFYHNNPHTHAPLEYTGDLWLRFMRWVHTSSAYGPVFTLIEAPSYIISLGKFVPTLYAMKLTMSAFFVYCVYLIGQLGSKLKLSQSKIIGAQLSLAFNPFLLLEVVVNAHNDAVMIALFLTAILFLFNNQKLASFTSLILSVGVKYITVLVAPILYLVKDKSTQITLSTLALALPVLLMPQRFQPWYLVWALIPSVLIDQPWAKVWGVLASMGGLIFYIPYIATGFWNNSQVFVYSLLYLPVLGGLFSYYHSRKA